MEIIFQPHVGPFDRAILSSVYSDAKKELSQNQLIDLYNDFYKDEKFVRVLKSTTHLKSIARSNYCHIYPSFVKGKFVIFSAIDNLIKGASGQAIQNMNLMYGFDEMEGLR